MKQPWLPLALAAALGGLAALLLTQPARGQARTPALVRGGGSAGVEKESVYRFTTLQGNAATAQFDRNVLRIPQHYGKLISVTMAERKPVLWYEDAEGSIRNVVLADAQSLVRLTREPSRER
jgi:hypothetical protein